MPTALREVAARLRALLRGQAHDQDFAAELESHLEMLTDDNIRRGMDPVEARRRATVRIGAATSLQSQHRDARGVPSVETLFQDVRFAVRLIRKDRWFSAAIIGVLALGIGANTLGFAIVNAAFMRGLPFPDSHQLHAVSWIDRDGRRDPASYVEWQDWRDHSSQFAELAGYEDRTASLSDDLSTAEQVRLTKVTINAFTALRQLPAIGRDFSAGDGRPGAEPVAILSHQVWTRRYGQRPDVLGVTIRIDGDPATVIGVMPEGMKFPDQTDIWSPFIPAAGALVRDDRRLEVFGRLSPVADRRQAQAEFDTIAGSLIAAYPDASVGQTGIRVETIPESTIGGIGRRLFITIMIVVVFVLLIAGANVANLLVLRSAARVRDMALRSAMGATRGRLVRLLLLESLVLSLMGAAVALPILPGAMAVFAWVMRGSGLPYWVDFSIDGAAIAYAAAITCTMALLFGLVPALSATAGRANDVLKDGGRGTHGAPRVRRFATAMVVIELTVAVALLGGAGLLTRSFLTLYSADLGVDTKPLVALRVNLPQPRYQHPDARRRFMAELELKAAGIPGVQAAAVTTGVPSRDGGERVIDVGDAGIEPRFVSTVAITPAFFDTIDIRVKHGRGFLEADGGGAPVAIINEQLASQFFPGRDPVGLPLRFMRRQPSGEFAPEQWRTIVGVVPDIDHGSPMDGYLNATVYLPYRETAERAAWLLLRTGVEPLSISGAVRREAQGLDPDLPVTGPRTIDDLLAEDRWTYRVFGGLFAIFAAIATLLSAFALYAVVAYGVAQRTAEFGLRIALGASRPAIVWMVLEHGLKQTAGGIALGLVGALVVGDYLSGMLVGVTATDPRTLAEVTLMLIAVSMAACLQPAVRAVRFDPASALRAE